MSKIKFVFATLAFLLLVIAPRDSFALETSEQKAILLNEETFLYIITYEFGFVNRDFRMPIGVARGAQASSTLPAIEYSFVKDGEVYTDALVSYAAVLSKANIENLEYTVPRDQKEKFMLVVIGKVPKSTMSEKNFTDISVRVDSLPYILVDGEKETFNQLHSSKLQHYVTPTLSSK